jgi:hypothetical protein
MSNQRHNIQNKQLTETNTINVESYDVNVLSMQLGSSARLQVRMYDASDNYIGVKLLDVSGGDYTTIFGSSSLANARTKVNTEYGFTSQ